MILIIILLISAIITYVAIHITQHNKKKSNKPRDLEKEARKILGISNYNSLDYDDDVTEWLDTIIAEGLLSGIKKYDEDTHFFKIEFNNGVKAYLWNANKYFAWLHQGYIIIQDEETNEDVKIEYNDVQPTALAMLKLKNAIDKFLNKIYIDKKIKLPNSKVKISRTKVKGNE